MHMSQVVNDEAKQFGILKVIALVLGVIGLVAVPIMSYAIGQLIANHMALNDLLNGYSYSAFYQIVYNATHVNEYQQMSQLSQGASINEANSDYSSISLASLIVGLLADIPLALKLHRWLAEL